MQKIDIPYYSQYDHVKDESWRPRACGVTSLKMVLDWAGKAREKTVDDLIEEGVVVGGYTKEYGWSHDTLVRILRNNELSAYRQAFKSRVFDCAKKVFNVNPFESTLMDAGVKKIVDNLRNGVPVIVSMESAYWGKEETHLVVLSGYDDESKGFFYHNPNNQSTDEYFYALITENDFKKYWRKMAIFVEKNL